MMKKTTNWTVLIYGIMILLSGYVGYAKGGSTISLYMGIGFGISLIFSGTLMFFKIRTGFLLALFLSAVLTATFGARYAVTHKQTPAILAVLSGGILLFLLTRMVRWTK